MSECICLPCVCVPGGGGAGGRGVGGHGESAGVSESRGCTCARDARECSRRHGKIQNRSASQTSSRLRRRSPPDRTAAAALGLQGNKKIKKIIKEKEFKKRFLFFHETTLDFKNRHSQITQNLNSWKVRVASFSARLH